MESFNRIVRPDKKDVEPKGANSDIRAQNEQVSAETKYSTDREVSAMTEKVVASIAAAGDGEPNFGDMKVEKARKTATLAMKADPKNSDIRFRPGSRLRTYTGVRTEDGALKDETYGGEAYIKEGTTIYRNTEPLLSAEGQPIKGRFEDDGTFVEDQNGLETLYNEYATDNPEHPKKKYGIVPQPSRWTEGLAQIPSYLVEIPTNKGDLEVKTGSGKLIGVKGGDFIVVDAMGGGKTGVQAIERGMKEKTYRTWEILSK